MALTHKAGVRFPATEYHFYSFFFILWEFVSNSLSEIPIDVTDFYGWTATMCAAGDGNFEICKYLLENGADPGVRDKNGMGILQIAQKNRKETFVRLLMDYFCNGLVFRDPIHQKI